MFIEIPDDAPKHYEFITKTVTKSGERQGRFCLPATWVGGRVVIYHVSTREYFDETQVLAHGTAGAVFTPKKWICDDIIAFLVVPPPPVARRPPAGRTGTDRDEMQ